MESISVDFHGFAKSVFYPGDTMNYMYSPHLRSFDYFIASHHGGRIGVPNLGTFHMGEIIINSYHSNYLKKDYLSNRLYYGTKASKVTEQISNTGLLGTRITLK